MDSIEITVKGLGGTICNELYFVAHILKQQGYDVTIDDEYPPDHPNFDESKESLVGVYADGKSRKITVKAHHVPWPG